jgi:chromosomal replication initiation ATPase DnaA
VNQDGQLLLDLGHRAAFGAEDFLPAPCNQEALAWLARWPDWRGPGLVLFGPEGCGKTHLTRIFATYSGAVRLEPEALGDLEPVPDTRVLIIDPAEPVADEAGLLRTYNLQRERGGHLLLTARTPVAAWPIRLPDLASRLRALPPVEVRAPDDALLGAVLFKLFRDRQLRVPDGVITYLVQRMERSFAAARRIVAALDALSLKHQRAVTVVMVRDLLHETATQEN